MGQTITLSHLAPFVDISRQKIRKELEEEWKDVELANKDAKIKEMTEKRVKAEIKSGIQTINYQYQTLLTTNGCKNMAVVKLRELFIQQV